MTCPYCGQIWVAGDLHDQVRPITPEESIDYPEAIAVRFCRVNLRIFYPQDLGAISDSGEGQGPEPTLTDADDYAS